MNWGKSSNRAQEPSSTPTWWELLFQSRAASFAVRQDQRLLPLFKRRRRAGSGQFWPDNAGAYRQQYWQTETKTQCAMVAATSWAFAI